MVDMGMGEHDGIDLIGRDRKLPAYSILIAALGEPQVDKDRETIMGNKERGAGDGPRCA